MIDDKVLDSIFEMMKFEPTDKQIHIVKKVLYYKNDRDLYDYYKLYSEYAFRSKRDFDHNLLALKKSDILAYDYLDRPKRTVLQIKFREDFQRYIDKSIHLTNLESSVNILFEDYK